jgi:hypothetical protein
VLQGPNAVSNREHGWLVDFSFSPCASFKNFAFSSPDFLLFVVKVDTQLSLVKLRVEHYDVGGATAPDSAMRRIVSCYRPS